MKTAILVDGGFYRKRAAYLWGKKTPEKRAAELRAYCSAHLKHEQQYDDRGLYRIFYYDCPPLAKTVYHPLLKRGVDFRHSDTYTWTEKFFDELRKQRKVALRLGELSDSHASYNISSSALRDICSGAKSITDLKESDFSIAFQQNRREGVDFILDPMWAPIKSSLFEHIDGLMSQWGAKEKKEISPK